MAKQEEIGHTTEAGQKSRPIETTAKVRDHLANERTFLAWIRTGLATITFGFVVERFGLVLRELGLKGTVAPIISVHYSSIFGVALTLFGVAMIIVSLFNFLSARRAIEREQYHPSIIFAVGLTVLASLIGILLAIYLALTA